jgi:hypothetical protein
MTQETAPNGDGPEERGPQEDQYRQDEAGPGRARAEDEAASAESDADRRRRRAIFLRELHEARELRARVQPRRARAARMRQAMRLRSFRW